MVCALSPRNQHVPPPPRRPFPPPPISGLFSLNLNQTSVHRGKPTGGSGSVTSGTGEDRNKGKDTGLLYPGDLSFATKLLSGVKAGKGESWARSECHDYTQVCVCVVSVCAMN